MKTCLTGLSLFACTGIGDLAMRAAGIDMLVANELSPERADLFRANFPACEMITGDIWVERQRIIEQTKQRLGERLLDVVFATPPCQGMSKNGRGKLLREFRDGRRPEFDPRNLLATAVPKIAEELNPKLVIFENVPEMLSAMVPNETGAPVGLMDFLTHQLANYVGTWKVVEFADYGVPQRRQRLITIFVRRDIWIEQFNDDALSPEKMAELLFPRPTHAQRPGLFALPWVTVEDAIGHLPKLDGAGPDLATSEIPLHRVPVLDERKYWWISHTPEGKSAFDNQCVNPACGSQRTPVHAARRTAAGINQAATETPIYCIDCGSLLPRPVVDTPEGPRLMSGFTSAYKRMSRTLPAPAITRNVSYVSSDQKVHPTQHRALSLYEAMILHTLTDYPWTWVRASGREANDNLIRDALGESIPPRGLQTIVQHVLDQLKIEGQRGRAVLAS